MPPRKSNVSQISAIDPEGGGTPVKERDGINIEDLSLPRTMVQRLAKGVLPPNTSLHKDAVLAMSKSATVFVNYLAQAASEASTNQNKRTIPPPAILEALVELEFDAFVPRVEAELKRFSEVQVGKRNEYRRKVKEKGMGKDGGDGGEGEGDEEGRERKRVRRSGDGGERGGGGGGEEGEDRMWEVVSGDGHEQLMVQDEGEEDGGEEEVEGEGDDGGGEEGEGDEEGDEEEEDEDEYPDEGRRLSSVEREAHEGVEGREEEDRGVSGSGDEDEEEESD
ncbi:hypothetical protein ACLMJK_004051 [Lecanora helva]